MTGYFIALAAVATTTLGLQHIADQALAPKFTNQLEAPSLRIDSSIDAVLGIQMNVAGVTNKLIWFELTNGANAMLHGYAPAKDDIVEWYVRDVDCAEPETSCRFELAIRKKEP